jgi:hypothetical protein
VRIPLDEHTQLSELAWRARTSQSRALRAGVRLLRNLSAEQLHAAAEDLPYKRPRGPMRH